MPHASHRAWRRLLVCASLLAAPLPAASPQDEAPEGHQRMLEVLAEVRERDEDRFGHSDDLVEVRRELEALRPGRALRRRWELLCIIGLLELRQGDPAAAIEALREAVALQPRIRKALEPGAAHRARRHLAVAWLRLAETQNCIARHTSESCILPIGPGGVHVEQEAARSAIAILGELLEETPDDLQAAWLLNVACMTVGEYPEGVPEAFRVSPGTFASDAPFPRFVDVAPELGVNPRTQAGGAIVDDFDGDGVLDVVTSSLLPRGKVELFTGAEDGTFQDRTSDANLDGIVGGLNLVQADHDDDGWTDVLVLRGGWMQSKGRIPNSLLRNQGDGVFVDVTFPAGLAAENYPTQTGGWADYDDDGDLDLYVGNESSSRLEAPCQLFRNHGDGTFEDVAAEAGVRNLRYTKGVTWGDKDGDGDQDLFVSNRGWNRLLENEGDGTFEDVAAEAGVLEPRDSFATWFWDHDNDGDLDLFAARFVPTLGPFVKAALDPDAGRPVAALFENDGRGGFTDAADAYGLGSALPAITMGANFGDVDSDGFLDFYLGTGFPDYEALMPNRMFWNRGGEHFADVTTAGGFGHLQKGHAIAFADLDADGDQDVYAEMGGAFRGDAFGNALFRNPGFGNHWIALKLVGVRSNRSAIGARIRCQVSVDGEQRTIHRHVSSGGSFGANPLRQTVGLGEATEVEVLEIHWPTSGTTQVFRDVEADAAYRVIEGEERLEPLP